MKAANPKPSSDAGGNTYGSFANLKITAGSDFVFALIWLGQAVLRLTNYSDIPWDLCMVAEKLVKEQASVKTDLEMAVCLSTFLHRFFLVPYGKFYGNECSSRYWSSWIEVVPEILS
jgi:hypothetical protein